MQTFTQIVSALLRLLIIAAVVWGISLCAFDPDAFMGGRSVWLYFTIQSNVWIGLSSLVCLVCQILRRSSARWVGVMMLVTTVSITLTGVVFCSLLAPTFDDAFDQSSILLHVIVPVAGVLDYLLSCRSFRLRPTDALYALIPPLYYLGFASLGYVLHWPFSPDCNYPYFFLDWGSPAGAFGFSSEMPWMGVMYYVLLMLVVLFLYAFALVRLSRRWSAARYPHR